MTKRSYITARRVAAIESGLKPIQRALLDDVARLNVASGRQLRRLQYRPTDNARRMARLDLANLVEHRVLARLERRIGGQRSGSEGFVYALDVAGQRLTSGPGAKLRYPWTPGNHHLRHALAVSELYVAIRETEAHSDIRMERFDAEPRSWRFYRGPGGSSSVLKPDAYLIMASSGYDDSWFIEMDRSTEPLTVITAKARAYCRYWQSGREQSREGVFPTVLWVVPDDQRRTAVINALASIPAEHWQLFRVITFDRAAEAICSGELINKSKEVEL
jgi:hypothetical protein